MQVDLVTDATALCRVCMTTKEGNHTNLYDSSSFAADQPSLHGMLQIICAPVFGRSEAGDPPGMPTSVCSKCRMATVAAFELYQMCVATDRQLSELLALRWKLEEPNGSDPQGGCASVVGDTSLPEDQILPLKDKMVQDPLSSNENFHMIKDEPLDLMDENEEDCYEDKEEEADISNSQILHRCEMCNKTFKTAGAKTQHIAFRHPDLVGPNGPYTCDLCGKTFGFSGPLRLHRNIHLGELVCSCGQTFAGKKLFNAHIESGTCTGDQDKECKVCDKTFRSRYGIANHHRKVHAEHLEVLPEYFCDICKKSFQSFRTLNKHKKTQHETGKEYKCTICGETFATGTARDGHRKRHKGPFKCNICDQVYTTAHGLKGHMVRHTGQKPFACDLCPMRFFAKVEIQEHMLTHSKVKNHTCEICGSRFSKVYSMKKHMRFVHEGQRPYECSVCGFKCSIISLLKRHMLTHTGEKPHKCQLCPQAYAQSNDLVKHVARVHGIDKPYQCDRCDEAFRLMTDLRQHYRVHAQSRDGSEQEEVRFTSVAILQRAFVKEKLQQTEESEDSK